MSTSQAAILLPVPPVGRFLTFGLYPGVSPERLRAAVDGLHPSSSMVLGLGPHVLALLGVDIDGMRAFPALSGPGGVLPSTQGALWAFMRGDDPGEVHLQARRFVAANAEVFRLDDDVATFRFAGGRDLTGYEDGTENPEDRAADVALRQGGSFVAVQRWVHELEVMAAMPPAQQDHLVGRHRETNEELDDAPDTAHVKRAAQEDYAPPAFMLRRSMPWGHADAAGLVFVAFAASLDPYEQVMRRMLGMDDGKVDGLFQFSRPVSGGYYWCPPTTKTGALSL